MKFLIASFLSLILFSSAFSQATTYILIRHAEKDSANEHDPILTTEGKARAKRLFEIIKKYNPEQIFATAFQRTRGTVEPLANNLNPNYRMFIQSFDSADLKTFYEKLININAKCIVVVGHAKSTPRLANLLVKQEKYPELDEETYNKIYIIRIKGSKITDELIEY